jgi:hypothetical protein
VSRADDTPKIVGLLRVRNCCLFTWRDARDRNRRTIFVEPQHCAQCIAELRRMGPDWNILRADPVPSSSGAA